MPGASAQWPINWDQYEQGRSSPRQGSVGSSGSRVQFDESTTTGRAVAARADEEIGESSGATLRPRR